MDVESNRTMRKHCVSIVASCFMVIFCQTAHSAGRSVGSALRVGVDPSDGSYTIAMSNSDRPVLHADVAVLLDGRWIESKDYPHHVIANSQVSDDLGTANQWMVTFSGLPGEPDLIYRLCAYPNHSFADIQAFVRNPTAKPVEVEAIRSVKAVGNPMLDLGGPALEDRVLSDSFKARTGQISPFTIWMRPRCIAGLAVNCSTTGRAMKVFSPVHSPPIVF